MSGKALEWAITQGCSGFAKLTLLAIAHHHSFKQPYPFLAFETIGDQVGINEKTARRSVDQLEDLGLISVKRSTGRRSHTYTLHLEPGLSDHVNPDSLTGFNDDNPDSLTGFNDDNPDSLSLQPGLSVPPTRSESPTNKVLNKVINNKDIAQTQKCANAQKRFPDFWAAYPKKRDKAKSLQVWKSKSLDPRADYIIADIQNRLAKDKQWQDAQYIPYPTTYLRNERWEDETEQQATPKRKRNKFVC